MRGIGACDGVRMDLAGALVISKKGGDFGDEIGQEKRGERGDKGEEDL